MSNKYYFENYKKRIRKKLIKKHIWILSKWVSFTIYKSNTFKMIRWKPLNYITWYDYEQYE